MFRLFDGPDTDAAKTVAARGGRALHVRRLSGRPVGFLFDQDADRLLETAAYLKAPGIVSQLGELEQHLHLEGSPLRSAVKIAGLVEAARDGG